MVLSDTLIQNMFAFVAIFIIIFTLILPRMWKYFTTGLLVLSLGMLPLLYDYNFINLNLTDSGLFKYLIIALGLLAGRELVVEGIKEENKILKAISIIFGLVLVCITSIPSLYQLGAITFTIMVEDFVLYILYILSGLLLAMGSFVFGNENNKKI
jgi:hypothetical protein